MVDTYNSSPWESETGELQVCGEEKERERERLKTNSPFVYSIFIIYGFSLITKLGIMHFKVQK